MRRRASEGPRRAIRRVVDGRRADLLVIAVDLDDLDGGIRIDRAGDGDTASFGEVERGVLLGAVDGDVHRIIDFRPVADDVAEQHGVDVHRRAADGDRRPAVDILDDLQLRQRARLVHEHAGGTAADGLADVDEGARIRIVGSGCAYQRDTERAVIGVGKRHRTLFGG